MFQKDNEPLASRMRPRTLDEFSGQEHILGKGRLLRRAVQADRLTSLIFCGPPGTGKTTLARIIANTTRSGFTAMNAVLAGKPDIRDAVDAARKLLQTEKRKTILFIDEVHRFNKAQQDALLPHVENGLFTLIGATTENPYFEVNKALLSRSRVFPLYALNEHDLQKIAEAAIADKERGYGHLTIMFESQALEHIIKTANGDARAVLNALELAVETTEPKNGTIHLTLAVAEESIQKKAVLYDRDGDAHYDAASAFIKSIRGSDPDAALFWMAKMVYAGEDPRFIFRRMLISASEDIGLADPQALRMVVNAARAFDYVGLPEGRYHLSQACLYLATAPKSNSTLAFFDALREVEKGERASVPDHLRDASRDKEGFGHGKGYLYPHSYREHWVEQQYLPDTLKGKVFYRPSEEGFEKTLGAAVGRRRDLQLAALDEPPDAYELSFSRDTRHYYDNWLRRTLQYSSDLLQKVSEEIFIMLALSPESLVFDFSGGKGILTWEACSLFHRGGVWSRCGTPSELQKVSDWANHISAMSRPHPILAPWDSFGDLRDEGELVRFDGAVGYNLFDEGNSDAVLKALKQFSSRQMSDKGVFVLSQIDYKQSQTISGLLSMCDLSRFDKAALGEIALKIKEYEQAFGESGHAFLKGVGQEVFTSLGFERIDFRRKIITSKRFIRPDQVRSWKLAEKKDFPNSALPGLRAVLTEQEWNLVLGAIETSLAGKEIPWAQGYAFLNAHR